MPSMVELVDLGLPALVGAGVAIAGVLLRGASLPSTIRKTDAEASQITADTLNKWIEGATAAHTYMSREIGRLGQAHEECEKRYDLLEKRYDELRRDVGNMREALGGLSQSKP